MALRHQILYLVLLTVVVTVRAQGCSLESLTEPSSLEAAIVSTISSIGDSTDPPDELTIYDQNVVCLAADETLNEYRYASVVVLFSCVGDVVAGSPLGDECATDNYTAQFDFECRDRAGNFSWQESREPFLAGGTGSTFFNPADASLSTERDTFCSLCVDPDIQGFPIGSAIDPITHCAACSDTCLESPDGQELCYGINVGDCCNFFEDESCVIQCSDGTEPQLQGDGRTLVCQPACEDLPPPTDGSVNYNPSDFHFLGTEATYTCDEGHTLGSPSAAICEPGPGNGTAVWSTSTTPTCTIVDCGSLTSPDNGNVQFTMTTYSSQAMYTCDDGFTPQGGQRRTCQSSGQWSGDEPTCEIDCGELSSPANGKVQYTTTTYGSNATYTCDDGYSLGNTTSTRTCQGDGQWSGQEPTCDCDATCERGKVCEVNSGGAECVNDDSDDDISDVELAAIVVLSIIGAVMLLTLVVSILMVRYRLKHPLAPKESRTSRQRTHTHGQMVLVVRGEGGAPQGQSQGVYYDGDDLEYTVEAR